MGKGWGGGGVRFHCKSLFSPPSAPYSDGDPAIPAFATVHNAQVLAAQQWRSGLPSSFYTPWSTLLYPALQLPKHRQICQHQLEMTHVRKPSSCYVARDQNQGIYLTGVKGRIYFYRKYIRKGKAINLKKVKNTFWSQKCIWCAQPLPMHWVQSLYDKLHSQGSFKSENFTLSSYVQIAE